MSNKGMKEPTKREYLGGSWLGLAGIVESRLQLVPD
jgi:hypothetical protein